MAKNAAVGLRERIDAELVAAEMTDYTAALLFVEMAMGKLSRVRAAFGTAAQERAMAALNDVYFGLVGDREMRGRGAAGVERPEEGR